MPHKDGPNNRKVTIAIPYELWEEIQRHRDLLKRHRAPLERWHTALERPWRALERRCLAGPDG